MVCWARYFAVFCFACFKASTKTLNNPIGKSIPRDERGPTAQDQDRCAGIGNHSRFASTSNGVQWRPMAIPSGRFLNVKKFRGNAREKNFFSLDAVADERARVQA